jgi:hypothetical protein
MKLGNEFWLILFREYISPNLFAVWRACTTTLFSYSVPIPHSWYKNSTSAFIPTSLSVAFRGVAVNPEAEFLVVTGTKVLSVFLLAIYSQLC